MQISLSLCVWYMCGHVHRFRPILMATQTVLKLQLHLLPLILYIHVLYVMYSPSKIYI